MAESTESSTHVEASPDAVLAVIADLERYPEWVAGVKEVEVLDTKAGRPSRARFVVDQAPIRDTYVLDYVWKVVKAGTGTVSWSLVEAGTMTRLDGSYELVASGEGTEVTYRLSVDAKIKLPGLIRRRAEKTVVDTALKGLRRQVEG
jgi:ribosome-associated toxin RatA of RatAB toxin-antitoxin module